MKMRWLLATGLSAALASMTLPVVGCDTGETTAASAAPSPGCDAKARPANMDFVLKDMHGNDVRFADYKGKVVLLNFWATWCAPCKSEIPAFVQLQDKYRDQGVAFLGFSVDDPVEALKPFAAQYKMNYPVLVGSGRDDVQDAYGPMWGVPVTVFISRDGKICKRHLGEGKMEQFEKEIQSLL